MHEVTATTMPAPHSPSAPPDAADDGPSAEPADPDPDQPPCSSAPARPGLVFTDPARRLTPEALAFLRRHGAGALAALRPDGPEGDVRVRLIDDAEMAQLHQRTLGDPTPTDVLTFDLGGDPAGPLDVDLALGVDAASRQATARGHALERELLLYFIHGVLHCLGHDDHDEAEAAAMHAREDEILRAIGVGPVFACDNADGTGASR